MLKSELLKKKIEQQRELTLEISQLREDARKEWEETSLITFSWNEIIILWWIIDTYEKYARRTYSNVWESYGRVIEKVKVLLKTLPN